MKSRFLLDVVIRQGTTVLQLLAREDETLLVRRDSLLVLDLGLNGLDRVRALHIECDGLAGESLNENLHVREFVCELMVYIQLWFGWLLVKFFSPPPYNVSE